MIYFDNAATGGFKTNASLEAVNSAVRFLSANPGRSGHRLSVTGAEIVYKCREKLANFFNASASRVIFTKNCTESLNTAIFGALKVGGHIITTALEHNSVLRPLSYLQSKGLISLDIIFNTENIVKSIAEKIRSDTYMVITSGASNVTGEVLPVCDIGALCNKKGILYVVDGAQAGGHIDLDIKRDNISMLCLAGHKGLYGIMGSGVLILNDNTNPNPLMFGGTGTESLSTNQPTTYPERLESGTLNLPAIASLSEGIRFVSNNFKMHEQILKGYTASLIDALKENGKITLYSAPNPVGIVSFKVSGKDSLEIADILNSDYDIAVRGGFHCAPLTHKKLGTENEGLVRVSLAVQNSTRELSFFVRAINEITRFI